MTIADYLNGYETVRYFNHAKFTVPVFFLTLFWFWESWRPFFGCRTGRYRHAVSNILLALFNALLLGLFIGTVIVVVCDWTARAGFGLLNLFGFSPLLQFISAIVLLDAWMYLWHRVNHSIPFLWRFHRIHHSDNKMDVTTATRFHLGEHLGANILRLASIPFLGLFIWHILVYELLVIAITQFHHADISLGRFDRWLRSVIVTPDMHKMHHSRIRSETDSNFSTFFSFWDRLASTFRIRSDLKMLKYGLDEFDEPQWQTFWGMLKTPFGPVKHREIQKKIDLL